MPQKINVDELPDNSLPIPRMVYRASIKEIKQDPSASGYCMDTLKCEILEPDTVVVDNGKVGCAGREFTMRVVYSVKALRFCREGLAKLNITLTPEEWQNLEVPTTTEVESKAYTRIPAIQDLTKLLPRTVFDIELHPVPYFKTDTGKWNGRKLKDENNQDIVSGYGIEGELKDIVGISDDKLPF